ncbi:MAG: alpha/beta hydrolase [Bacteroidota bacterium]
MIVLQIALVLVALLLLLRALNLILALRWYNSPRPPGAVVSVQGKRFYYRLAGTGDPTVIIEPALATPSVEWWSIQEELSKTTRVLTYDRAGYGWSDFTPRARTSGTIALELSALLASLGIEGPLILVGHSQGGLYVNHFARLFPEKVAGAVFLDPLSPRDNRFKKELAPLIYKNSGVDKSRGLKMYNVLCMTGILRLLKPLIIKAPPFRYYNNVPSERIKILWQNLLFPKLYKTALSEYRIAQKDGQVELLTAAGQLPPVPVRILYHSPKVMVDEIMEYGGIKRDEAEKVEALWEELVREYLTLSPKSEWITAEGSGHFIHLQSPDLVVRTVLDVIGELRQMTAP